MALKDGKCLVCFERVQNDEHKEIDEERQDESYGLPEVDIPILCEVLKLSLSKFSSEEYNSYRAPVCFDCDSSIKRISGLLEDLKRIQSNLTTLRQAIQAKFKDSLLSETTDGIENQRTPEIETTFELLRNKIIAELNYAFLKGGTRVKDEPISFDSDYEDVSNIIFNEDTVNSLNEITSVDDSIAPTSVPEKKRPIKTEPSLKLKKSIKRKRVDNKKTHLKKLTKQKLGRNAAHLKTEHRQNESMEEPTSSKRSVSRSGRLRRSTTKPDFLYKGEGSKSVYVEDDLSDENVNERSRSLIKVERGEHDPMWQPNNTCPEPDFDDRMDDIEAENSPSSESSNESENNESESKELKKPGKMRVAKRRREPSDVKSPRIRRRRATTPKPKVKKVRAYKHIIDPDLTEAQIRLIGSNKKPMESSCADKLLISKNGKKSIDMSSIVKDESIAVVQINEQLYGKRFSCTEEGCRKTFVDKESRDVHVRRKHEKNPLPFVCEACSKAFRQFRTLKRHRELNCQDDNVSFSAPRRRKVQVKLKSHLCQYCPEKYRSPSELQIHVRKVHTGETPFKCQYCEQSFISALKLEHHTEQNHDEVAPIKCEYCSKGFFREHRLKIHIVVHTGERPYLCEICCKSFALKNQLTYHQTMHNEQLAYKFRCEECNKNFASPQNLKQHKLSVHEKSYRYICEICNHGSAQMSTHRVHMRTHTGEKPFRCHFCEKAYINGSMLKIHLRNHTGERPYVCQVCQKGFTVKSKLDRHELLHKEERPFQCTLCTKAFTTVSYLNSHYKSSHKHHVAKEEVEVIDSDGVTMTIPVSLPLSAMPLTTLSHEAIPVTLPPNTISVTLPLNAIPVSLPMSIPYTIA